MADQDNIEGWPSERARLATIAQLHALGQISLLYNYLEDTCGLLFGQYMPTDGKFSKALFERLNNRERVDLLSAVASKNEKEQEVKDAVLHFLLCYDICTTNRNILAHVRKEGAAANIIKFSKPASNDPTRKIHFDLPLTTLRLVADQIGDAFNFGMDLAFWLSRRENPLDQMRELMVEPYRSQPWPGPLPDKPQKPQMLTPSLPPTTHKVDFSQPLSFEA
jgi:hypothetical protein